MSYSACAAGTVAVTLSVLIKEVKAEITQPAVILWKHRINTQAVVGAAGAPGYGAFREGSSRVPKWVGLHPGGVEAAFIDPDDRCESVVNKSACLRSCTRYISRHISSPNTCLLYTSPSPRD